MRDVTQDPIFRAELREMFGTDVRAELEARELPYDLFVYWMREGVSPRQLDERRRLDQLVRRLDHIEVDFTDETGKRVGSWSGSAWGLPDRLLPPSHLKRRDLITQYARHVHTGFHIPESQVPGWKKRMDQILNDLESNRQDATKIDEEARRAQLVMKPVPQLPRGRVKVVTSTDADPADVLETAYRARPQDLDALVALIQESMSLEFSELSVSKGRAARVRSRLNATQKRQLVIAFHRYHTLESSRRRNSERSEAETTDVRLVKLVLTLALGRDAWLALVDQAVEATSRESLLAWLPEADGSRLSDAELRRLVRQDLRSG